MPEGTSAGTGRSRGGNVPSPKSAERAEAEAGVFATTCWSVVLRAGWESDAGREALEVLCRTYWFPVYALVRRRGFDAEAARDLAQGFFVQFLERDGLSRVRRERGCFRAYLARSVHHFLSDERDRERALKRGGGREFVRFDEESVEDRYLEAPPGLTPDRLFDRQWALEVIGTARRRLEREYSMAGLEAVLRVLDELGSVGTDPLEVRARNLGMPVNTLKSHLRRARLRQARIVRELIAETVESPARVEAELRDILAAMED